MVNNNEKNFVKLKVELPRYFHLLVLKKRVKYI